MLREPALDGIGEKACDDVRRARRETDEESQHGAACDRHRGFAPFLPAGEQLAQPRRDHFADHVGRRCRKNLTQSEQADRDRHDPDAVAEFGNIERIAKMPGHVVDADGAEHQPGAGHQQRTRQRGRGHVGEEDQAEHEQRRVFRRAEPQGKVRERRRDQGEHDHAEGAGDPGTDRSDAERGAGAAVLRHGVAVDAGHHRGSFAGNAHQDRCGGAAVLRAVVDAGEHHHCAGGVEAEGRRQQNADPGQRSDPRQHADDGADQTAEEGVPQHARL